MKIPEPFLPVTVKTENLSHTVSLLGRSYTFGPDGMITSITSCGQELLHSPMRVVMIEDGNEAIFDDNYEENESESFIQSRCDESVEIYGCKQSERFILNFKNTVDYDGNIDIAMSLMTRGATVAEAFGIKEMKAFRYKIDKLWLEIPLRKELCTLYHFYTNSDVSLADGTVIKAGLTTMSGKIFPQTASTSFKTLLWLGNENLGLGWFAENDRNWQPESKDRAIEIVQEEESVILRIRLLDFAPVSWKGDDERGCFIFTPVDFNFGFHATPVKPFPKEPVYQKTFHLDCGTKIKGHYKDFMTPEKFDKLKEAGVTTLILHEKWNKIQNWFSLSEYTSSQLEYLCSEAHKRGIKLLPYFGYEISTFSPLWDKLRDTVTVINSDGTYFGGWWRVPFQRDYAICYNSEYADLFTNGVIDLMDKFGFDGVYLDSTAKPRCCHNEKHGCAWHDDEGNLHGSFPLKATRKLFKKLYKEVKARGGQVNVHTYGVVNFTAIPYIDLNWYGENLQSAFMRGNTEDIDLDYFRAEYSGRNMGVPVEFIVYENRPLWTFENALSCSLIHGILPRPNDIEHPLELMSKVWRILDSFPIASSSWLPYWENDAKVSHEKVRVSYYKHTDSSGKDNLLAFVSNISSTEIESVTLEFSENAVSATDAETNTNVGFTFGLEPYGYKILFIK